MAVKLRHDPPISGVPAEFTVMKSMTPALCADACLALARTALIGASGPTLDPQIILGAEIEAELWLGVARYEQRLASASAAQSRASSNADGEMSNSS